jgi:hypothetical protein
MGKARVNVRLEVGTSREQGIEYLFSVDRYSDWQQFSLASLVLIDFKIPGMSGFEV